MNSCLLCEKEEEKIEEASFGRLKKQAVLYEEALVSGWQFGWFDMLNPCNSTYNSTFIRAAMLRNSIAPEVSYLAYSRAAMCP